MRLDVHAGTVLVAMVVIAAEPFAIAAMTAADWVQVIQGVGIAIGAAATGVAGGFAIYFKAYDGSSKQQVDLLEGKVKANGQEIDKLRGENGDLRAENAALHLKIEERDRSIALRDDAIKLRDIAIDTLTRAMARLGSDTADMAEAFLIQKGDAKSRDTHG